MATTPAIHHCVHTTGTAFIELERALTASPHFAAQVRPELVKDEFDRFKIWAGNIAAHRKGRRSLEYRLRDASHLKDETHNLFSALDRSFSRAQAIVNQEVKPWEELSDSDSDSGLSSEGDDQEDTELKQLFASIKVSVTCLFRLSMAIRDPAPESQLGGTITVDKSYFEEHDILHAQAKFPGCSDYLTERFGRAISGRRQYLSYRETHHQKLSKNVELIGFEQARTEHTTNSTEATPLPQVGTSSADVVDVQDSEDALSQTSYATSVNATIRVPPLPKEARTQDHFECPLCFMIVSIHTSAGWKQHVYRDLHPYCCTFEHCSTADRLYETRHAWYQHELEAHRSTWQCVEGCDKTLPTQEEFESHVSAHHPELSSRSMLSALKRTAIKSAQLNARAECPLCKMQMTIRALQRHVGRHQEQLALFALPPNLEATEDGAEDDEADSDVKNRGSEEESSDSDEISDAGDAVDALYDTDDDKPSNEIPPAMTRMGPFCCRLSSDSSGIPCAVLFTDEEQFERHLTKKHSDLPAKEVQLEFDRWRLVRRIWKDAEDQVNKMNSIFFEDILPKCNAFIEHPPAEKSSRERVFEELTERLTQTVITPLESVKTGANLDAHFRKEQILTRAQSSLQYMANVMAAGPKLEIDSLVLVYGNTHYPVHFPAQSIQNGNLRIGAIRRVVAEKLGVNDAQRVQMFFKGKNLNDNTQRAHDEGLRGDGNGSEIMCVVSEEPDATDLDAPERETDVLVFKSGRTNYPTHFPQHSIRNGVLTIKAVRQAAAKKIGVDDPQRIRMFFTGKHLKDDNQTARYEGMRGDGTGSEVLCIVGETPMDNLAGIGDPRIVKETTETTAATILAKTEPDDGALSEEQIDDSGASDELRKLESRRTWQTCPKCKGSLLTTRFADHLEKCQGNFHAEEPPELEATGTAARTVDIRGVPGGVQDLVPTREDYSANDSDSPILKSWGRSRGTAAIPTNVSAKRSPPLDLGSYKPSDDKEQALDLPPPDPPPTKSPRPEEPEKQPATRRRPTIATEDRNTNSQRSLRTHEPLAERAPCKYFTKGNCKFGFKCALAHVLPNGHVVNRYNLVGGSGPFSRMNIPRYPDLGVPPRPISVMERDPDDSYQDLGPPPSTRGFDKINKTITRENSNDEGRETMLDPERAWACQLCGQFFHSEYSLFQHHQSSHPATHERAEQGVSPIPDQTKQSLGDEDPSTPRAKVGEGGGADVRLSKLTAPPSAWKVNDEIYLHSKDRGPFGPFYIVHCLPPIDQNDKWRYNIKDQSGKTKSNIPGSMIVQDPSDTKMVGDSKPTSVDGAKGRGTPAEEKLPATLSKEDEHQIDAVGSKVHLDDRERLEDFDDVTAPRGPMGNAQESEINHTGHSPQALSEPVAFSDSDSDSDIPPNLTSPDKATLSTTELPNSKRYNLPNQTSAVSGDIPASPTSLFENIAQSQVSEPEKSSVPVRAGLDWARQSYLTSDYDIRNSDAESLADTIRNPNHVDPLISNATDAEEIAEEIEELLQQKRLLRNRQTAFESQQPKMRMEESSRELKVGSTTDSRARFERLSSGWFQAFDNESGATYYYDVAGNTQWRRPTRPADQTPSPPPKPKSNTELLQDITANVSTNETPSTQVSFSTAQPATNEDAYIATAGYDRKASRQGSIHPGAWVCASCGAANSDLTPDQCPVCGSYR